MEPEVQRVIELMTLLGAAQREELGPRIYEYHELAESAKETVRDRWREYDSDRQFVSEDIHDSFIYRLCDLGYCSEYQGQGIEHDGLKVLWSLSGCQGDGVAFEGAPDDITRVAKRVLSRKDFRLLLYMHKAGCLEGDCLFSYLSVSVEDRNGRYHHWNSFNTEVGKQGLWHVTLTPRQEEVIETLQANIQEELVDLSHELERLGNEILYDRNGDDYIDSEIYIVWEDRRFYVNGDESS